MTTQQSESLTDPQRPKVSTFKPSSFQVTQFEVLTEATPVEAFKMAEYETLEGESKSIDPMFEVYDDLVEEKAESEPEVSEPQVEEEFSAISEEKSVEFSEVETEEEPSSVKELRDALITAERERKLLEEEHQRQLEALKTSLTDEIQAETKREGEEKIKAIEERYAALIEDMNAQIREGVEGVERRAVEFAVQVAKKLVGTIVEINPEYVLEVIKEGVKLTGGATIKAIRVSPQDLEFLKMLTPEKQFKEFDGSWSFQADETIRAGCVIETSSGQVEFDIDKAWERIKESVTKVR